MRPNKVRLALKEGKHVFGTMIQEVASPFVVHALANAGYDFVYVDMEHGRFNTETAASLIQTVRLSQMTCLARASDNQYHLMARLMDAGAEGIMVPRLGNRQEVESVINRVRYPPMGGRGLAVARGHNDYQRGEPLAFAEEANRENLVIIQIERREAVDNIEDIITVPGVDVALIGPVDLSVSLGVPTRHDHPLMQEAIDHVVETCRKHKIWVGMHWSNYQALSYWAERGIQLLSASSDLDMLLDSSKEISKNLHACVK